MTIIMVQDKSKDLCGVPRVPDTKNNALAHKLATKSWISRLNESWSRQNLNALPKKPMPLKTVYLQISLTLALKGFGSKAAKDSRWGNPPESFQWFVGSSGYNGKLHQWNLGLPLNAATLGCSFLGWRHHCWSPQTVFWFSWLLVANQLGTRPVFAALQVSSSCSSSCRHLSSIK